MKQGILYGVLGTLAVLSMIGTNGGRRVAASESKPTARPAETHDPSATALTAIPDSGRFAAVVGGRVHVYQVASDHNRTVFIEIPRQ